MADDAAARVAGLDRRYALALAAERGWPARFLALLPGRALPSPVSRPILRPGRPRSGARSGTDTP